MGTGRSGFVELLDVAMRRGREMVSAGACRRRRMLWLAQCCLVAAGATLLIGGSSASASDGSRELVAAELPAEPGAPTIQTAQAEINLAIQHRGTKVDIVDQVRDSLGEAYAGIWFDTEVGEFVVPV